MKIEHNRVWISGGASGLGLACARRFAAAGARVSIFDRDAERGAMVAAEIGGLFHTVDVGDEISVSAAVDAAIADSGAPRVMINCAGIGLAARIVGREGTLATELFERTIRVNLIGTYLMMSHAARAMLALDPLDETGERGVIINTASVAWQDGQLGQAAYAASKGGIAAMCLPAAREFGQSGLRVMAIAPGLFETPMTEGLPGEIRDTLESGIPFPPRLGFADEFALMAEQIVANPYVNGTTFRLDGALRLPRK